MFYSQNKIIKGERLQQLADVYIGYPDDFCYNPLITREPEKNRNIRFIKNEYDNPKVVFCYTHCLYAFAKGRFILNWIDTTNGMIYIVNIYQ
jgi:hypothetical protein